MLDDSNWDNDIIPELDDKVKEKIKTWLPNCKIYFDEWETDDDDGW